MSDFSTVVDRKTMQRHLLTVVPGLSKICWTPPFQMWDAAICLWHWFGNRMAYPGSTCNLPPDMNPYDMFRAVIGEQGGVWCGGAAKIFAAGLQSIGLPACEYAYGYRIEGVMPDLAHVTTIVYVPGIGKKNRYVLLDAYMGYYYTNRITGNPLSFCELLRRIIYKEYASIAMHVEPFKRPYIIGKDEDPHSRGFLYPDCKIPDLYETRDNVKIYRGAIMTPDKLLRGDVKGMGLQVTPFGQLVKDARGDQPEWEFLLDLLLVDPAFDPLMPENDIGGMDRELRNGIITILTGGLHTYDPKRR